MPNFLEPTFEELQYHQKFLKSRKTMAFHHGTKEFPKEEWKNFYQTWVKDKADREYKLVFCPGCQDFVGEMFLEKVSDTTLKAYFLVKYEHRNEGYGQTILERIVAHAKQNHYAYILIRTYADNPGITFLTKRGFFIKETSDNISTLKLILKDSHLDEACSTCKCDKTQH